MKHLLLLLTLPLSAFSQSTNLHFQNIGVNEGLSQNSVYAIMQDRQGFIWIATGDGLNRFDGKRFKNYRAREMRVDSKSPVGSIINSSIVEDNRDRLWFATNTGLIVFDKKTETFNQIPSTRWNVDCKPIAIDSKNILWGYTASFSLTALNTETFQFTIYGLPSEVKKPDINSNYSTVLTDNKIWMATRNGLLNFDLNSKKFNLKQPRVAFFSIVTNGNGNLIVSSNGKIYRYYPETDSLVEFKNKFKRNDQIKWNSLVLNSKKSGIYAGSAKSGLYFADLNTNQLSPVFGTHKLVLSSFQSHNINCLFIDRSENLWIGTDGMGLFILNLKPEKFSRFPSEGSDLKYLMVKSIFEDSEDNIWAGTFNKGLFVINPKNGEFKNVLFSKNKKEKEGPIFFIYKDSSEKIWMNYGNKVGYVNHGDFHFIKTIHLFPPFLFESCQPYTIYEVRKDHFWIGTNSGIFPIKVRKDGNIVIDKDSPLPYYGSGFVYDIKKGKDNSIYLGLVRGGVWRDKFDGEKYRPIDSSFFNSSVRNFYFCTHSALIWMATDIGLAVYNSEKKSCQIFNESDGLSNSCVYGIISVNDSNLWLSTNKGIDHASIKYNGTIGVSDIRFNAFTVTDGLQSNEFNSGAFFKGRNNRLIFGGVNGINWFNPDSVVSNYFKPQTVLTGFEVNNKPYENGLAINYIEKVSLPHDSNTFHFDFASLEFSNPAANQFAYKMEGFDKKWILPSNHNEARYSLLPPGRYIFKVKSSNNDGIWNEIPASLEITINPPFWETWQFRILIFIIILTGIILITKSIFQRKLKIQLAEQKQMQLLNKERERIGREMHDEIGSGLTHITLMSESLKKNADKSVIKTRLDEMSNLGRKLIADISEITWSMNPENNTLQQLLGYLRENLNKLLEYSGMNYQLLFPEKVSEITISSRIRRNVLLVTKEIVNNSIKHSKAQNLYVKLWYEGRLLMGEIRDNGVGFNTANPVFGNGLNNIQKRMEELNGNISISSEPNKGTEIKFSIPLEEN